MKKITFLSVLSAFVFIIGCTSEDDFEIPNIPEVIFSENFQEVVNNQNFVKEGWTNFNEQGSTVWRSRIFSGNGYVEFNTFQSGDIVNIGWLITPKIDKDRFNNPKLRFKTAQNFVTNNDNKIQIFVSNNYNGVNVLDAEWIQLDAEVAKLGSGNYVFIDSGIIDLSPYTDNDIHIAFKVIGSGTNTNLDGLFQVDDISIFN